MKCYIRIKRDDNSYENIYVIEWDRVPNINDEFIHDGYMFKVMRRLFNTKTYSEVVSYCIYKQVAQIEGFQVNEINIFDDEIKTS